MPQRQHVHPQLMTAPGFSASAARGLSSSLARNTRQSVTACLPGLVADLLPWPVGPVDDQWQVDRALPGFQPPGDTGDIGLSGLAFLELQPEMALRMGG